MADNDAAGEAPKVDAKTEWEIEKLKAEVGALRRPWHSTPTNWIALITTIVAIGGSWTQCSKAERELDMARIERSQTELDVRLLTIRRDSLQQDSTRLAVAVENLRQTFAGLDSATTATQLALASIQANLKSAGEGLSALPAGPGSAQVAASIGAAQQSISHVARLTTAVDSRSFEARQALETLAPGKERWAIKVGADPEAGGVDRAVRSSTIKDMVAWVRPSQLPQQSRIAPIERQVWSVQARLIGFSLEADGDYHLTLRDDAGRTMIAEIPNPTFVPESSPFAKDIASARAAFDRRHGITRQRQPADEPVEVVGVGFFDAVHGQSGAAPNGVELHPVLRIVFQ